jgi:hypothetical protein
MGLQRSVKHCKLKFYISLKLKDGVETGTHQRHTSQSLLLNSRDWLVPYSASRKVYNTREGHRTQSQTLTSHVTFEAARNLQRSKLERR